MASFEIDNPFLETPAIGFSGNLNMRPDALNFGYDPNLLNTGYLGSANQGLNMNAMDYTQNYSLGDRFNQLGNYASQNKALLNFGLGAAKGIADSYNTFQNNKTAKSNLAFQKQQYATNLDITRKQTNMDISDRQARRVSANPNAESVDSYMKKWGV